jgi:hypothetical protein
MTRRLSDRERGMRCLNQNGCNVNNCDDKLKEKSDCESSDG